MTGGLLEGLGLTDPLAISNEEAARLTRPEREERLQALVAQSRGLVREAIEKHVLNDGRKVAASVALFSGGNDSTTLAHLFRGEISHAAHANTTIGVEQTREFVRTTCKAWGVPLIERKPPREIDHYRALVLDQGFPGPGHHYKMFQRLKERALMQIRSELVSDPRRERVIFIAGRRRQESQRRASIPEMERRGSVVYVSPLVNWTKPDLTTYRLIEGDVPRNGVSDLIHMSGECLCGAFAHDGEREEISFWFPGAFDLIHELETLIADRDDIPEHRKRWGWGADPELRHLVGTPKSGLLCSSCEDRFQGSLLSSEAMS